jgi:hypothetical protein
MSAEPVSSDTIRMSGIAGEDEADLMGTSRSSTTSSASSIDLPPGHGRDAYRVTREQECAR